MSVSLERGRETSPGRGGPHPLTHALVGGLALASAVVALAYVLSPIVGEVVVLLALTNLLGVLGLGMFSGNSGVLNFGQAAFFGIGAYASGLVTMDRTLKRIELPHLPTWLAHLTLPTDVGTVVAMAVAGAIAMISGIALMRMTPMGAAIGTLGLLIIVNGVLTAATSFTNGAQAFYGVNVNAGLGRACLYAGASIVIGRVFRETRLGLQLRASREDLVSARSMGVPFLSRRLVAWTLGAMFAAAGGALYAHVIGSFSPGDFYLDLTFTLVVMLIVGGGATVSGCVVGTVTMTVLLEALRRLEGTLQSSIWPNLVGLTQIGLAAALLLIVIRRPSGLVAVRELDDRLLMAIRRRRISRDSFSEAPGAPGARPAGDIPARKSAGERLPVCDTASGGPRAETESEPA